jgi:hypothetical protein
LPNGGHSTIDLQEGYFVFAIVLFVVEGHSIELQRAQPALTNVLVDDSMLELETDDSYVDLQGHLACLVE